MKNWFRRRRIERLKTLPDHESGVRRMMADASGDQYLAFETLRDAQAHPDGIVVFEGDYGGQIYLVVRAATVRCSEETLNQLVADLDAREWADPEGARVFYEARKAGQGVAGGMGGGAVPEHIWTHKNLRPLEPAIVDVLEGRRERIQTAG